MSGSGENFTDFRAFFGSHPHSSSGARVRFLWLPRSVLGVVDSGVSGAGRSWLRGSTAKLHGKVVLIDVSLAADGGTDTSSV
jgi:hypothetical protein